MALWFPSGAHSNNTQFSCLALECPEIASQINCLTQTTVSRSGTPCKSLAQSSHPTQTRAAPDPKEPSHISKRHKGCPLLIKLWFLPDRADCSTRLDKGKLQPAGRGPPKHSLRGQCLWALALAFHLRWFKPKFTALKGNNRWCWSDLQCDALELTALCNLE